MLTNAEAVELLKAAKTALPLAYCPYSRFPVAAAVHTVDGDVFTGVNVENACTALGICAERAAVSAMIAGAVRAGARAACIDAVAVVAGSANPCYPCGACLQVISEFAATDCVIVVQDENGEPSIIPLSNLLPHPFKLDI